jgi:hypothetical protein
MAVSLTHSKVSSIPDGADTSLVRPSDWNAEHVLSQGTGTLLGRTTAGTGATEEITPSSELTLSAGALGVATTLGAKVIEANSSGDALRITQTGTGNALLVEDSANPDASPFVVDASGNVGIGTTAPTLPLTIGTPTLPAGVSPVGQMISSDTAGTAPILSVRRSAANGNAVISQYTSSGTAASPTAVADGRGLGRNGWFGFDGTNYIEAAFISAAVDGTPGTNDMPGRIIFATTADGGSSPVERVRIDNTGDVGIGTTNPTARLNVVDATSQDAVRITQTGSGNALVVEDSANPDSSPFVIDASGNVVVGKTTSDASFGLLQMHGTGSFLFGSASYANNANATIFQGAKSRGASVGTQTVVQNGDDLFSFRGLGSDGTGFIRAAQINISVDGVPGTNDMPGRIAFSTTADGASVPTERMRIDSAGNVAIGTFSVTAGYRVDISGKTRSTAFDSTSGIYENNATITADYTIATGNNAMSAGPITINSGITVTVPSGSVWTIV